MKQISVGIIGTGWCGGIRAETCAANPVVKELHIAETRPERLAEVARACNPRTATADYRQLLEIDGLDAVMISATPETTHYPMARASLLAGKHVFLEKPIAIELHEADELVALARRNGLKFTIGYSQRFNPKFAYVRKAIVDGSIGRPVSALVSRHITREPRHEDHRPRQALPRRHGIDARSRLRAVVPGAGEAGAGLFAGELRRDEGSDGRRRARQPVDHGHHGQRA